MACGGEFLELTVRRRPAEWARRSLAFHERFWGYVRCKQVFWHSTHQERFGHIRA